MQTEMLSPSSASNKQSKIQNTKYKILDTSSNFWQKGFTYKGIFTVYIFIFLAIALAVFFFFYYPKSQILGSLESSKTLSYTEAMNDPVLIEVNQLMEFPKDKEVTFGEIKDQKTLEKYQEYFKKAQVGQLLIILDKMTIIYDPSTKTIIDIANVKLY